MSRLRWAILVASVPVVFVTACGGSGSDSPTAQSSTVAASGNAALQAKIKRFVAPPTFTAPGPAITDMAKARTGSVFTIPYSSANPFCLAIDSAAKSAAKAAGIKYTEYTNQGSSNEWIRGVNTAISQKVSALILTCGLGPVQLGPQIAQAKKAGVPVVIGYAYDPSQPNPPNIAGNIVGQFEAPGQLMADWAITHSDSSLHALVLTDNEYPVVVIQDDATRAEFQKYCPDCSVKYLNVATADWASKIPTIVQTAITSDPKLSYILPAADSMTPFVVSAINRTQAQDRIRIATFNGTPSVLDLVRTGDIVEMDIGSTPGWIGYAMIDEALRLASGMSAVSKEVVGFRIFDKSNVSEAGVPADAAKGYGNAYINGYRELWGLPPTS